MLLEEGDEALVDGVAGRAVSGDVLHAGEGEEDVLLARPVQGVARTVFVALNAKSRPARKRASANFNVWR